MCFQDSERFIIKETHTATSSFSKPFILQCGTTDCGVWEVLIQECMDGRFPVEYASRKHSDSEKKYAVIYRRNAWL